jgi:hypothetical protein
VTTLERCRDDVPAEESSTAENEKPHALTSAEPDLRRPPGSRQA